MNLINIYELKSRLDKEIDEVKAEGIYPHEQFLGDNITAILRGFIQKYSQ